MNAYQKFIFKLNYARWTGDRREEWPETVARYQSNMEKIIPGVLVPELREACKAILNLDVMPSMRALWAAGPALENDNIAGYNCAYTAIDNIKVFADILYILMNGAGVGFSTERQYIAELPEVPSLTLSTDPIVFGDSKLGWAEGYELFLRCLYSGVTPSYDLSHIRPKGAPLKTFGGRASGPEPLKKLLDFTIKTFKAAQGRKLKSIEVYDIVCMIADCVVSGGVRRSATMNLSNLSDTRMRGAKDGQFWLENPQRSLSNNSVAYTEKPDMVIFMEEWIALMKSGAGERGIFNRGAAQEAAKSVSREVRDFGCNPCGEIVLRNKQFCNLTEVVIRPADTLIELRRKVKQAVLLGAIQSTLTSFKFIDPAWQKNCEEERLLGVSLTGLMDHPVLNRIGDQSKHWLQSLKATAVEEAGKVSELLGINTPAAITCVKPSGTVSQLVNSSSGLHARFARYYIRRVRVAKTDPMAQLLVEKGVPVHPEVGQTLEGCSTLVFEFPVQAPAFSVFRGQRTALGQLEYWKLLKLWWCEHNPSCTIYVKEAEWLAVGAWVYENWNIIGGLSFLPFDGGLYQLAPYEEISRDRFYELDSAFPHVEFDELVRFEKRDSTTGSGTYACVGDKCEL
jgi:ribonucleoside-diphosphate reductase alpha chain